MPYKTIAWLRRNVGWRLNLLFIAFAVALTDLVVASVEMIVLGSLRDSTLLVATVSGLIVATVVVGVAGSVRGRIARLHRRELEASFAGAKAHFGVAVETAQMLFWEIDLRTGALGFEHDKLTWLGLSPRDSSCDRDGLGGFGTPARQSGVFAAFSGRTAVGSTSL